MIFHMQFQITFRFIAEGFVVYVTDLYISLWSVDSMILEWRSEKGDDTL